MMRLLSPGLAWVLAAPAVILVLYLLRRKFLPQQVPSVFLWQKSIRDYAATHPFQKLMRNLLLPVQMLAALILALALLRPVVSGGTAGRTVLIFDISGSMQTQTSGITRLDLAKEEARKLIGELPAEEEITILTAGKEAERLVLAAGKEEAEQAINSIVCERGGADLDRAISLADAVVRNTEKDPAANVVVYSDGLRRSQLIFRSEAVALTIINCGAGEENRSVYSLKAENGQAFARVANYGEDCYVTLVCEADGILCDARETEIPAGETAGISFSIPETAQHIRVSLREKDALDADNAAEATAGHSVSRKAAVISDSVFLESALRVRPDLTVLRTEEAALCSTEADLYILGTSPLIITRCVPEEGYDSSATAFGPFSWTEAETEAGSNAQAEITENPLTSGLTLKHVFFRRIRPVTGGKTAVAFGGEPVVAYTEDMVALGFDLHDSNLPLKYDFPVLIQNILNWLLPAETAAETSDIAPMPLAESDVRTVAPDDEPDETKPIDTHGKELTGILLAVFLFLLLAEMGVSRYVG